MVTLGGSYRAGDIMQIALIVWGAHGSSQEPKFTLL